MSQFQTLLDGYHRFRRQDYQRQRERWSQLAEGQQPPVMIIGCCDSRVDPATVFDLEPGQAFILRNVANLVPPFETGGGQHGVSSAIEFAVTGLEVDHIVVMGHASCGGVAASIATGGSDDPESSFIERWIGMLDEARRRVLDDDEISDKQLGLEQEGVRQSLANLRTFPFITEREAAGKLSLHGCHFGIAKGQLSVLDEESDTFVAE